jgi:hypothetical protein
MEKTARARNVFQFLLVESHPFEESKQRLKTGRDQETAAQRQAPHIELKDCLFVHAFIHIALHHGQLVKIGQKRTC